MKKLLCILLCAAMTAACLPAALAETGTEVPAGTVFDGLEFSETESDGFLIPTPEGSGWSHSRGGKDPTQVLQCEGPSPKGKMQVYANIYDSESPFRYAEDPVTAEAEIRDDFAKAAKGQKDVEEEFIDLDGHPVGLMTYDMNGAFGGRIAYVRNTRYLMITAYVFSKDPEKRITLDDMKALALRIGYDETRAPFTAAKATFTVKSKDGTERITAGKSLQMEAVFDDRENISKKLKNDTVNWAVVNAATGEEDPAATITPQGQLKVDRSLGAPVELEVKGTSAVYGTEAACRIFATPVITGVNVEPAELFFYVGTDEPQTVKAAPVPDTVPPEGITWTPAKEGTVEITPLEDGAVSIRPLAAGKATITVAEPSGKSAKLSVSVVPPVETVELTVKGSAKAGGTVTVSAALEPKDAGNKAVEWSLDVGEDVATITAKGQVKISKDAPAGTIITVTCTALGAPEPVTATAEIEVQ